MISLLILLIDVTGQALPRGEASEEVEGMQNVLAGVVTVILVVILVATLIAIWRRR